MPRIPITTFVHHAVEMPTRGRRIQRRHAKNNASLPVVVAICLNHTWLFLSVTNTSGQPEDVLEYEKRSQSCRTGPRATRCAAAARAKRNVRIFMGSICDSFCYAIMLIPGVRFLCSYLRLPAKQTVLRIFVLFFVGRIRSWWTHAIPKI